MKKGVISKGIICPFIREGDDLVSIVVNSILEQQIGDRDVIGITESVVARSQGNYVTVDDIAKDIENKFGKNSTIYVLYPIYSRNRFSMILKGIARTASKIILVMSLYDEVGNVVREHPFTNMDYDDYYREICKSEKCDCTILSDVELDYHLETLPADYKKNVLYCGLHNWEDAKNGWITVFSNDIVFSLADICSDRCDWGLLGSNKVSEERLKLFPTKLGAQNICDSVKSIIKEKIGKDVIVCIYGDGCFKDPVSEIWEFADPITMPAYTDKELLESTPNEIKLKSLIDNCKNDSDIRFELENKELNLKGNMKSMGTTPRLYRDLLASLMDLTSGSGDRETPVILIQNYFNNEREKI